MSIPRTRRRKAKNLVPNLQRGFYLVHVNPDSLASATALSSEEAKRILIEIVGMRP